jgi:hypothetical protein
MAGYSERTEWSVKAALALAALCLATTAPSALANKQAPKHAAIYPPHHQLWLCIHRHEAGSWTATNGRYRGGLQMHLGWGYGIYDAALVSQAQQEWAAERAFAASGYSYSFLAGQWYDYDGGAGCGTTG